MIASERQLEMVLPHFTQEATRRAAILFAVERGITRKPKYVRIAIDELIGAKRFGKAAGLASRINDRALAGELLERQYKANVAEVILKELNLKKFEDLLSKIEDSEARRGAIVAAVKNGITHKLDHVRLAIQDYELIGPGAFADSERAARSVGAVTSQICELEGWIGLAAHMSESEGLAERTADLYGRYVQKLEEHGRFGLAAELSFYKLGDLDRAARNGKKAGLWELVSEMERRNGNEKAAHVATRLAALLR